MNYRTILTGGGNKLNTQISTVKAIGIIMVVLGHIYSKNTYLIHMFYTFHMPLFFICSGYFFRKPDSINDIKIFVIKKTKGLYLPFLKFSFIFLILHNYLINNGIGWANKYNTYQDVVLRGLEILVTFGNQDEMILGFWFLKILFFASIFVSICCWLGNPNSILYSFCFISICLIMTMFDDYMNINNMNFHGLFFGASFFYVGYLLRPYIEKRKDNSFTLFCLLLLIVFVGSRIFDDVDSMELRLTNRYTTLPFFVLGVLGTLMVFEFSNCILRYFNSWLIFSIGNNTLYILALHFPCILIYRRLFGFFSLPFGGDYIIASIVGVFTPLIIKMLSIVILNKIIKVSKYVHINNLNN